MKPLIILGFVLTILFSPGFQCGRDNIYDNCPNGQQTDTVYTQMSILNASTVYRIGDTIKFSSKVNDSINSSKGASFIHNRNAFNASIQPYRVVNNGGLNELVYANIEFNPIVHIGQFQNYPYNGYNFLYQRLQPYNTLQVSFVAGRAGLYIFNLLSGDNYSGANYIHRNNDYCTGYPNAFAFPISNQNVNYWDGLGISSISLANTNNYRVANKTDKNYVFVKVIP
jgi:hypothetical protein